MLGEPTWGELRDVEGRILLPTGEILRTERPEPPGPRAVDGLCLGRGWSFACLTDFAP